MNALAQLFAGAAVGSLVVAAVFAVIIVYREIKFSRKHPTYKRWCWLLEKRR